MISNMPWDSDMWKCVMDHDVMRLWWACNIGFRARCVSERLALCGSIGYSLRHCWYKHQYGIVEQQLPRTTCLNLRVCTTNSQQQII